MNSRRTSGQADLLGWSIQLPVTADVALAAYELPEPFHRDPADRLISAMGRLLKAAVLTIDRRILGEGRQGHVDVLAAY